MLWTCLINSSQLFHLYSLSIDCTETPFPRIPPLLSDTICCLLPCDGPGIVDVEACFGYRGNVFTGRWLAMDNFCFQTILAFSHHATLLPPQGWVSWVAHRNIAISWFLRGNTCDICDRSCEWHLNIVLAPTLMLPFWGDTAFGSGWCSSSAGM